MLRTVAATILLCLASVSAQARPSPYPPPDRFLGDRYDARQAQMGVNEVIRAVKAKQGAKARWVAPTRRHVPPRAGKGWRHAPIPVPRPLAYEPYRVEAPVSIGEGVRRVVTRAIGRPAAWCGWWLGHHLGMPLRKLWLARNWASVGSNAGGPQIGAVVVWRHHVGIITGRSAKGWVVKSGNDGHAVRERVRSLAGVIAYRYPNGSG